MREWDFRLYEKYYSGAILDKEDEWSIYRLASMGLAHIGISELEGKMVESASLTSHTKSRFRREKILRSPIKRFFYYLVNA